MGIGIYLAKFGSREVVEFQVIVSIDQPWQQHIASQADPSVWPDRIWWKDPARPVVKRQGLIDDSIRCYQWCILYPQAHMG